MTLKVIIGQAENQNLAAWCESSELFQFDYRKETQSWLFWLRGNYDPHSFPQKEFPRKFFEDACLAMYVIRTGAPMPGSVIIVEGEKLIEKQEKNESK